MEKSKLILGDAKSFSLKADIMLTDPPYDMDGEKLAQIINNYECNHLVLIATMGQFIKFANSSNWKLNFDFILNGVSPKKSKSRLQPHYVHQNGFYMTRNRVRSIFDRKRRQRSDVYESNGYWPTIFHAPRNTQGGYAKNMEAITDLLGSFDAKTVVDPVAGTGTTGWAAIEVGMKYTLIEKDPVAFEALEQAFLFTGCSFDVVGRGGK